MGRRRDRGGRLPVPGWEDETRLFERSLANERQFLDGAESAATREQLRKAAARVPVRDAEVPGLANPNERMEKGFAKTLAYRVLASEGVVSRNVAKRLSGQWGRDASKFHRKWHLELEEALSELGLLGRLRRFEHHVSHAANAYFTSGFDPALIVTLDGYGSGLAGSVAIGRDGRIERLHGVEFPHSLGTFYESVTSGLGFNPIGTRARSSASRPTATRGALGRAPRPLRTRSRASSRSSRATTCTSRACWPREFPKIDVAAAYQHVLEEVAVAYVSHYVRHTGIGNLVLSGGVAANVKLNQRIHEIEGVERIFVHPNMGDGGCGTGAAYLAQNGCPPEVVPLHDVYLGPAFDERTSVDALRRAQLPFDHYEPIAPRIAGLLAAGRVVARFDGRMEYGPRALGNRSILYHAKRAEREPVAQPAAGPHRVHAVRARHAVRRPHECYRNLDGAEHAAEFMTMTFDCTPWMKENSPAAVHVDGTARPQLVTRESNPPLHELLTEYHQLTGIPSVINTSFNMHEEPIVCTPDDAIRAFLQGNLDYLAIGNCLVAHPSMRR